MSTLPVLVNEKLDVQQRLSDLRIWHDAWKAEDYILEQKLYQINPGKSIHVQKGAQISTARRRLRLNLVQRPLEISIDDIIRVGYEQLSQNLRHQFASLSRESRKYWMQNFLFIMTPDLRRLYDKIDNILSYRALGQQRNFLLGGPSGMGKTTCLDFFANSNRQVVEAERNHVPVVKIDAPVSNHTPKPLFQRIILECGLNYLSGDNEEDLLMKISLFFQICGVDLLVIDEIEHVIRHEIKRRILEISNLTRGIPIVCASCHPLKWLEGDLEVAGRWNDYLELKPYIGTELQGLLSFIELLLPFSQPSYLANYSITVKEGKQNKELPGPAQYIEKWTKGILRDIMILIIDATNKALERGLPNLTLEVLEETWKDISDNPPDILNLVV